MRQLDEDEQYKTTESILYDRYAPAIFAYLYRQSVGPQDAEDVVVEVFMAAFGLHNFVDMPAGEQLDWLRQVARNKMIDHYRRDTRLPSLPLELARDMGDTSLMPEQQAIQRENSERPYQSLAASICSQLWLDTDYVGNGSLDGLWVSVLA